MTTILKLIKFLTCSKEMLLFIEILSVSLKLILFSFKLILMSFLVYNGIRENLSKKLLAILMGVIIGSMFHSDISWISSHLYSIFNQNFDFRLVGFMNRLGWAFFILQNQSLSLLFEYLSQRKFTLNKKHLIFLFISIFLILCELYYVFFEFNRPALDNWELSLEKTLIVTHCTYLFILLIPILYKTLRSKDLPKILSHQLKTFIVLLIVPHIVLDLITNKLFFFPFVLHLSLMNKYIIQSISTLLITYAIYYCCKRMMGLRFLNFKNHVEAKEKFNFINDFKDILEQLSYATSMKELSHLTQIFFKDAFNIPVGRTRLYVRKDFEETNNTIHQDIISTANKVESFLLNHSNHSDKVAKVLAKNKIFISDEIEFSNYYDENSCRIEILNFLTDINADIFLPIYERHNICAYIIIEKNARQNRLYNSTERDEMLVFTSYISNILNIIKNSNLDILYKREKELKEELFHKHQEINQYKESIRSFLKSNKERKIGIIFYKNRHFNFINQNAEKLVGVDINTTLGHETTKIFKNVVRQVQEFKIQHKSHIQDAKGNKLIVSATPNFENNNIIILVYYPEISDILKSQIELLKDPSAWDYILYLETTKSGQLINQLIPGNSENLINFKINLLSAALSKKATLLEMPDDDLIPVVEILHHIGLRQTLHVLKLSTEEKNNEAAIKLFGVNPLFSSKNPNQPLLEKLDKVGTIFIQNIHNLSLETQEHLSEYITFGFFHKFKSDFKVFSNVKIICSSTKNLQNLVNEGRFSKTLFNELVKTSVVMPPLSTLSSHDITALTRGFTNQTLRKHTFKNLLYPNEKETTKIINQKPVSLLELKNKIQQLVINKSKKNEIFDKTEFDPAYNISNPELAQAIRLGKKALKDKRIMQMLWDKFKNQNKIANFLGVNRSSVNRRCHQYNLK